MMINDRPRHHPRMVLTFSSAPPDALGATRRFSLTPSPDQLSSDTVVLLFLASPLRLLAENTVGSFPSLFVPPLTAELLNMDVYCSPKPSSPFSNGAMWRRKKNLPFTAALRPCARCMFASTRLIGMYKFKSKVKMTRVSRVMKVVKAAFSKSVS